MLAPLAFLIAAQSLNPDAVVIVGQSLANGSASTAVTDSQVGSSSVFSANLSSETKNCGAAGSVNSTGTLELAPSGASALVENTGLNTEKPRAALAAYYYGATGRSLTPIQAACGGGSYAQMKKGQTAFTWLEYLLESYGARVRAERVIASVAIHGEQDRTLGTSTATYKAALVEWQSDIQNKVRGVTESGAVAVVPLLVSQTSSSCTGTPSSLIVAAQYEAFKENSSTVILVQPTYPLTHNADDVHLVASSYQIMGAQFGKVVVELSQGRTWLPFYPVAVSMEGAVITVQMHVPHPPIVRDTTLVESATSDGFSYTCASSPPAISSVDCTGECVWNLCSCVITLASVPGAPCLAGDSIRYAWPTTSCTDPGPVLGARGNYRDSDTAEWQGAALYNWLVHFEESVP